MEAPHALQISVDPDAVLQGSLALLGDPLAIRLLFALEEPKRFGDLQRPGTSSKTLSGRLKRMERLGLVSKTLYAEVPPRTVYALTPKGSELVSHLLAMVEWEHSWRQ